MGSDSALPLSPPVGNTFFFFFFFFFFLTVIKIKRSRLFAFRHIFILFYSLCTTNRPILHNSTLLLITLYFILFYFILFYFIFIIHILIHTYTYIPKYIYFILLILSFFFPCPFPSTRPTPRRLWRYFHLLDAQSWPAPVSVQVLCTLLYFYPIAFVPLWRILRCPIYIRPLSSHNFAHLPPTDIPNNPSPTAVQVIFFSQTEALEGIKHRNMLCFTSQNPIIILNRRTRHS